MQKQAADIDIARAATPRRITQLAQEVLGIDDEHLEPYGHYKAKVSLDYLYSLRQRPDGRLILVTAMSPTPAGEGKTTTVVGLGDALRAIGKNATICLREPSMGPVFGLKGGAAGGGFAQVVPMEDINLHFTGDFAAIAQAHNLLAAMIDNHIHHGNVLDIDPRRIVWRRVLDMNDRALRQTVCGLGGTANGFAREDGFDIVVASEVMAVFCLAGSIEDLKARLGRIVVAYSRSGNRITSADLGAHGAMTVLLRNALAPNLVQTLEHTPAFIHGGPFANIAHGCNSVIATQAALKLSDYVVTEAGFGADLGAEKFINIKCRKAGLWPSVCVVVATIRSLKYHGGADAKSLLQPNEPALRRGFANLERHVENIRGVYGLPCVVAVNRFTNDTDDEFDVLREHLQAMGVTLVETTHWAQGSRGAVALAQAIVSMCDATARVTDSPPWIYRDEDPLWHKLETVAKRVYHATGISASAKVRAQIDQLQMGGFGHLPVCIAKTPYSFSTDPMQVGACEDHRIDIREVRLATGAEFVVAICGDIMTMPGLPKQPAAMSIDWVDGRVVGLF